ncbi:MAG: hypothetical protein ACM3UO_00105 [Bacillota bacterium]
MTTHARRMTTMYPNVTPEVLAAWTEPVQTLDREELEARYVEMKMMLERNCRDA